MRSGRWQKYRINKRGIMKLRSTISFIAAFICCISSSAVAETYIGTYEVSYVYNATTDEFNSPTGSTTYNGIATAPIKIELAPGSYYTKVVSGQITGNNFFDHFGVNDPRYLQAYKDFVPANNPGSVFPAMGYNGGCTDPFHSVPGQLGSWWTGAYAWVGTSEMVGSNVGNVFDILQGQSLWLYWPDPWIYDNLGGTTMEIWQTAGGSANVPEPATMLLLGFGILALAGVRRIGK